MLFQHSISSISTDSPSASTCTPGCWQTLFTGPTLCSPSPAREPLHLTAQKQKEILPTENLLDGRAKSREGRGYALSILLSRPDTTSESLTQLHPVRRSWHRSLGHVVMQDSLYR